MINIFRVLLVLSILSCLYCLPSFIRGKRFVKPKLNENLNIDEQYYDQRLDHFNEALNKTWKQRYWVNNEFFDGNGPVFLMIGGEGEENPIWLKMGQWVNFGKSFNALLILVEHRFYGKSHPTEDLSTENLKYLSSKQALADLASFRMFIHDKYNLTEWNKWISFGGSYPGSLSAWFRLKYPHLVHASVASSAPMLALLDFSDYLIVVNQSLTSYNTKCVDMISDAHQAVVNVMASPGGKQILKNKFQTCSYIDTNDDIINFFSSLIGNFEGAVQYNKDNRAFEGAVDTNLTIDALCNIMLDDSIGDAFDRYVAVNSLVLKTYQQPCLDSSYQNFIDQMKAVNWNQSAAVGGRQWTYQTCAEFGFFQSTDANQQPFGQTVPVDFYTKQCTDIFGQQFNTDFINDAVFNTNLYYGDYYYGGSRVVFVNGKIDPWSALGFAQNPPNEFTKVVFINDTAHCADMYPDSTNDSPSLTAARQQIKDYITEWLKEE